MNSNSQSNGLSQAAEFQQRPDGGLYVEGVDELRQPLTQVGGTPDSQFSSESRANTFLDYQLTRQDNSQDMDTGAYVLPGVPVECTQMAVPANPSGLDDLQVIPTCFWSSQMDHPAARLLANPRRRAPNNSPNVPPALLIGQSAAN